MTGYPNPKLWSNTITENPLVDATEIWEIYNFPADAHPIHVHEVLFEVVNRQAFIINMDGRAVETNRKNTVIAYPQEITQIKMICLTLSYIRT